MGRCWYILAEESLRAGRSEEALQRYRDALQFTNDWYVHANLGGLLARTGKLEEAVHHLQSAHEANPKNPMIIANLALALADQGAWDRAVEKFESALELDPKNHRLRGLLACAQCAAGREDQARKNIQVLVREDSRWLPSTAQAAWKVATHPDSNQQVAERIYWLCRVICLTSDQPSAEQLDLLAAAAAASGRFDEAVAHAETALRLTQGSGSPQLSTVVQMRLELYRQGRVYHISVDRP